MLPNAPRAVDFWGLVVFVGYIANVQSMNARPPISHTLLVPEHRVKGSCAGIDLQAEGYKIGNVTVRGPFDFPWWQRSKTMENELRSELQGRKFTYTSAVRKPLNDLRRNVHVPTPSGAAAAFHISVAFVEATRCEDGNVDLLYQVYTIPPRNLVSGTPEWRDVAAKAPQEAVGLANGNELITSNRPFSFAPNASFNGWKQLLAGADLSYQRNDLSLIAQGEGSASAYYVLFSMSGVRNYLGPVARLSWHLNAESSSNPTEGGNLAGTQFGGQVTATTRVVAGGNLLARFGGLIQGGSVHSAPSVMAINSIANANIVSERAYAGLTWNTTHNTLSISGGAEFGSVINVNGGYWLKAVGDAVDQFWYSLPDHHPFELETRLGGGDVPSYRSIPVSERFFGGNRITPFMPGDTWQINSGPFIRAIPANRLYLTTQGAGATSFIGLASTFSYAVWTRPLVPPVVQKEVEPLLDGQLKSATSTLNISYAGSDPTFLNVLTDLAPVGALLDKLSAAVSVQVKSASLQPTLDDCNDSITLARLTLGDLKSKKADRDKYPDASSIPDMLEEVSRDCGANLNGNSNDSTIRDTVAALDGISGQVKQKIDALQPTAQKKATEAVSFSRSTIKTVLHDLNAVSLAPVGVLDWAQIGPSGNGIKGSRFGPGGGVRVELGSCVNFTLGYAFNINPQPGEGNGAAFFSMGVRDLFH